MIFKHNLAWFPPLAKCFRTVSKRVKTCSAAVGLVSDICFVDPGCSVTTVLLQVSHGKRPCVEMIPDQKPYECEPMISIMQQCWDQDHWKRPQFSGAEVKTKIEEQS